MRDRRFKNTGKLFKERREEINRSQMEITFQLKLCGQTLSNIERGVAGVPHYRITEFATLLQLDPQLIIEAMCADYRDQMRYMVFGREQTEALKQRDQIDRSSLGGHQLEYPERGME